MLSLARVRMMTPVEGVLRQCSWGWFTRRWFCPGRDLGADSGGSNAFLAAARLRVVRDAVPVQAPASAYVVPSPSVRGVDAGVSGRAVSTLVVLVESSQTL